jgi:hypothetical protein
MKAAFVFGRRPRVPSQYILGMFVASSLTVLFGHLLSSLAANPDFFVLGPVQCKMTLLLSFWSACCLTRRSFNAGVVVLGAFFLGLELYERAIP